MNFENSALIYLAVMLGKKAELLWVRSILQVPVVAFSLALFGRDCQMVVGRNKNETFKNIKDGIRERLRGSKENMLPKGGKLSCFDSNYQILSVQGNGFFDKSVLVEWIVFIKGHALVEMEKAVYSICLTKQCLQNKLGSYSRIVTHWWIKYQGQDIYTYIYIFRLQISIELIRGEKMNMKVYIRRIQYYG